MPPMRRRSASARWPALPPRRCRRRGWRAHPSAALIRSAYPVGSIWAAHQAEVLRAGRPCAARRRCWSFGPDADVSGACAAAEDAAFAEAVLGGATLGEAAERALAADAAFDFGTALVGLIGLGAFALARCHRRGRSA